MWYFVKLTHLDDLWLYASIYASSWLFFDKMPTTEYNLNVGEKTEK